MIIDSGSIDIEINKRLGILYTNHNQWLLAVAYNKSKCKQVSQDLVQDLYVYLAEKKNPKIFFNDSFNLLYCYNFLSSRFINYIKRQNKNLYLDIFENEWRDKEDNVYDVEADKQLEHAYDTIKKELDLMKTTRMWPSAKIYELYAFSDLTMEQLSNNIDVSKSTVFLNIKKIKLHLKALIDNPFKQDIDE
tara:strand:- start:850 stop:1422 length:573 start_codon:yes stop_codon:yes gene_type:complete